jgi:hypothetical protein
MADIIIGGVEASRPRAERFTSLIWGPSGIGKTTLASTMPGRIALINFDPEGPSSIADADNVTVFDLSGTSMSIVERMKGEDPLGIKSSLDHFDSYIIDSLTTIAERTLAHGIRLTKGATIERPSPGAYGARNAIIVELVRNVLAITAAHKKHVTFIAHEGPPNSNDDGVILDITLALGGQLPQNVSLRINEVWCMFETAKNEKMIICRKARMRTPVKSRMFDTMDSPEFEWKWNTRDRNDPKNMWIKDWFEQWQANNYKKLALPK